METISEKIERFSMIFSSEIQSIANDLRGYGGGLYSRLLLTTMLDTFAKVALPNETGVGKRYVDFVVSFGNWRDATRVSLLHLARLLEDEQRPIFKDLKAWVETELLKVCPKYEDRTLIRHPSDVERPISLDPEFASVLALWPTNAGQPIKVQALAPDRLRHASLLYQYRNHLVHELRIPGRGADFQGIGEPFYQMMTDVAIISETAPQRNSNWDFEPVLRHWELVYPLAFLSTLCSESLRALVDLLQREQRSPFAALTEGTYWIRELN